MVKKNDFRVAARLRQFPHRVQPIENAQLNANENYIWFKIWHCLQQGPPACNFPTISNGGSSGRCTNS